MNGHPTSDASVSGESHEAPAERVRLLCEHIVQIVGRELVPAAAEGSCPSDRLQTAVERVLLPQLEDGLRSLTTILRDDLLNRIAHVQQLEHLTGLTNDSGSLTHLLNAPPRGASPARLLLPPELPTRPAVSPTEAPSAGPGAPTAGSPNSVPVEDRLAAGPPYPVPAPTGTSELRMAAEVWRQGEQDLALEVCSRVIRETPTAAAAYLVRGQMYNLRHEFALALDDFTCAIALRPDHAEAHLRRGNILAELGDLERAQQEYATALRLRPDLTIAHLNRGQLHARQMAWAEAIADASAVLEREPGSANAYLLRGTASFQLGEAQQALADLNRAAQFEPDNAVTYHERGLVQSSLGHYEQALDDYDHTLRLAPDFRRAQHDRAQALFHAGAHDRALAAFSELIEQTPNDAALYYYRGQLQWARQDLDAALADYTQALALNPQFRQAQDGLRRIQRLAGEALQSETPPAAAAPAVPIEPETDRGIFPETAPDPPAPEPAVEVEAEPATEVNSSADTQASRPLTKPDSARNARIALTCLECGSVGYIGIDRLNRKFQCRNCRSIYSVQPDGKLLAAPVVLTRSGRARAYLRSSAWPTLVAAALLVAFIGGWFGIRSAGGAKPTFPDEIEARAELFVKAWVTNDADTVQMLTTSSQEGRVQTWLTANQFPLSVEEIKASRSWLYQMKVAVNVVKEKRDNVQLGVEVTTPVSRPLKFEQHWVREGKAWYFQPYPTHNGNIVLTAPRVPKAIGAVPTPQ